LRFRDENIGRKAIADTPESIEDYCDIVDLRPIIDNLNNEITILGYSPKLNVAVVGASWGRQKSYLYDTLRSGTLPSIGSVPVYCPKCHWRGTVYDMEPDIDGEGSLGCPVCNTIISVPQD
jgi:hypothetical protein